MLNLLSIADETSAIVENLMELGVFYYIILNAFGIIAIILKATEFQIKKRAIALTLAFIASGCWFCYFLFQGDFVSALINLVGVGQGIIFLQRDKHKWADSKFWFFFFLILQITLGVVFFKRWQDIFPILGGIFNVICYFVISRKIYRICGFTSLAFWLMNGVFKFYPIALINDIFGTSSAFIAIIRYDILKKSNKQV